MTKTKFMRLMAQRGITMPLAPQDKATIERLTLRGGDVHTKHHARADGKKCRKAMHDRQYESGQTILMPVTGQKEQRDYIQTFATRDCLCMRSTGKTWIRKHP